jgi:hypothetical protein
MEQSKVDDHFVVVANGAIYEVQQRDEDSGDYIANATILKDFITPFLKFQLPWNLVGVYIYGGVDRNVKTHLRHSDVVGKAVLCGNILCVWLNDWLMSKANQ